MNNGSRAQVSADVPAYLRHLLHVINDLLARRLRTTCGNILAAKSVHAPYNSSVRRTPLSSRSRVDSIYSQDSERELELECATI